MVNKKVLPALDVHEGLSATFAILPAQSSQIC